LKRLLQGFSGSSGEVLYSRGFSALVWNGRSYN
jgi:hypothetical protein